jgi:hypothetical protein
LGVVVDLVQWYEGYRILELSYGSYTDKKRDELYREILNGLGK